MERKRSSKIGIIVSLALALVAMLVLGACAAPAPTPVPTEIPEYKLVLASSATGSTGHLTTSIMASLIGKKTNGRIRISVVPTSGSIDATNRLRTGEVDIGGSASYPTLYEAVNSLGAFKGLPKMQVFPLFPMSRSVFQTPMLADTPIETWADLVGKKAQGGTPGSIGAEQFMRWAEIAGITGKVDVVYLSFEAGIDALRDRKVVMAHMLTAAPNPLIAEFSTRHPMKFLDFPQSMVDEMMKRYYGGVSLFKLTKITKTQYPGIVRDATVPGYLLPWTVGAEFPKDAAYWITKVVWENLSELVAAHPALAEISAETLKQVPTDFAPFHPGAMQYYKEAGLLK